MSPREAIFSALAIVCLVGAATLNLLLDSPTPGATPLSWMREFLLLLSLLLACAPRRNELVFSATITSLPALAAAGFIYWLTCVKRIDLEWLKGDLLLVPVPLALWGSLTLAFFLITLWARSLDAFRTPE